MERDLSHLTDVEASIRRMRWLGLLALPVLVVAFRPPPEVTLPVAKLPFTLVLATFIGALQVGSTWVLRRQDAVLLQRFGAVSTAATLALVLAVLLVFGVDITSRFWPLLVVPVLEGAHRGGIRGAWATWALASAGYVVEQLVHLDLKPEPGSWISAILWGVAILAIVAGGAGTLAQRSEQARREELERNRRLRELNDLRDEFTSILTHELRSPMTAINGYALLLRDRWEELDDERRQDFLEQIAESSRRVNRLTNDVLQVARAERKGLKVELEAVDLEQLAREVAEAEVGASDAHALAVHVSPPLRPALADPDRLRQVVQNLVSNAVKYSPDGGRVTLGLTGDDGEIVLTVADDGVGIPDGQLGTVFEKFARATDDRRIEGAGLGLYLTRMLVEAMDGTISVASTRGAGTTFTVRLSTVGGQPTGTDTARRGERAS